MQAANIPHSRHQARSDATRQRLCDAAIDILIEYGFHEFSFVKVCSKSGLSRGAIHYHYDNLSKILADVVAEIYRRLVSNVAQDLPGDTSVEGADQVVEILWSHLKSDYFRVLLEIRAAAASDPGLAAYVAKPNDRINQTIIADAATRFGDSLDEQSIRITFAALTGLALQYFTLVQQPNARADDYAADFITQLKNFLVR